MLAREKALLVHVAIKITNQPAKLVGSGWLAFWHVLCLSFRAAGNITPIRVISKRNWRLPAVFAGKMDQGADRYLAGALAERCPFFVGGCLVVKRAALCPRQPDIVSVTAAIGGAMQSHSNRNEQLIVAARVRYRINHAAQVINAVVGSCATHREALPLRPVQQLQQLDGRFRHVGRTAHDGLVALATDVLTACTNHKAC